jgi:tetratricopeptide (TPR) repeat protein/SAM-dependent methyltransferase
MNREQRRAAGRPGAKPAAGSAATTASAATLAELFGTALARHQSGALAEAERQYRHILTLFPRHADSLHNLGLIAMQAGNATAAVELIGRAININGRIAEYHYNIALAWRALNRMDEVAAHLERAVGLRSDYALAHLNLGNVRREQGRMTDAVTCYERVITLAPYIAAAYFNLANILAEQGRWDEAVARYQQALAYEPNRAETHSRLGATLLVQGKASEAIPHLQQALAFDPNLPGTYQNLSEAFLAVEDLESAIDTTTRALGVAETAQSKALFGRFIRYARFSADNEQFRKLLLRALTEGWARPRELASVCISLIKLDGVVNDCIARVNAAWPARLSATQLFGPSGLAALSRDRLLCGLLECDPVTDIGLERFLTNVRYAMLTTSAADGAQDEAVLGFYCAVARQCFVNEYVFSMTEIEADEAQQLRVSLEKALAAGDPYPALWPVVVGAYFPLHNLAKAQALLERSWPQSVDALLVQQLKEPAEERRIAPTIPVLTGIDDEVSRLVRQQYEESPYPRWVTAGPPGQPAILFERPPEQVADVLIAGCGTGLSTIEFAGQARGARILAIDLSLASLSYAKRMAQSLAVTNVEFAQADITRVGTIGRQFDFIDVSGVLHHLADPWQGWRVLLSLLRPGGIMQVGLYSDLARRNIVAARALIAERGYRPVPQDIRRCREDIIAAADPLLRSVTRASDFFTTSECRDLLFHVQEHRITLPEIKSFLAANNAAFAGFVADPVMLRRFTARFPERAALTDLDRWHAFETEAPDTFVNMYLFWVRKPAA